MITADAAVTYSAEAFQGEMLTVDVGCADFTGKGCDICYRLRHKVDGREVARVKTGMVFFDHATRRPAGVPPEFIKQAGH
jgi:acyl-CoA thioester hydrolase